MRRPGASRARYRFICVSLHVLVTALTAVPKDSIAIAHETGERVDIAGGAAGLLGATAMPEISVSFPLWRATCSAVHPTDASTANRWCTTRLPCSFRLGFAPRCVVGALHGVVGHFGFCPLPVSTNSGSSICAMATGALAWSAGGMVVTFSATTA